MGRIGGKELAPIGAALQALVALAALRRAGDNDAVARLDALDQGADLFHHTHPGVVGDSRAGGVAGRENLAHDRVADAGGLGAQEHFARLDGQEAEFQNGGSGLIADEGSNLRPVLGDWLWTGRFPGVVVSVPRSADGPAAPSAAPLPSALRRENFAESGGAWSGMTRAYHGDAKAGSRAIARSTRFTMLSSRVSDFIEGLPDCHSPVDCRLRFGAGEPRTPRKSTTTGRYGYCAALHRRVRCRDEGFGAKSVWRAILPETRPRWTQRKSGSTRPTAVAVIRRPASSQRLPHRHGGLARRFYGHRPEKAGNAEAIPGLGIPENTTFIGRTSITARDTRAADGGANRR